LGSSTYLPGSYALALDASGNLFVGNNAANEIDELTAEGSYGTATAVVPSVVGTVVGLAVSSSDTLYMVDQNSKTVSRIPYSAGLRKRQLCDETWRRLRATHERGGGPKWKRLRCRLRCQSVGNAAELS
jgi:hypothetical protein